MLQFSFLKNVLRSMGLEHQKCPLSPPLLAATGFSIAVTRGGGSHTRYGSDLPILGLSLGRWGGCRISMDRAWTVSCGEIFI